MRKRSNETWLAELRSGGPQEAGAIADLTELLRRSAFFYLRPHRHELKDIAAPE
ncbi:MAG: hypothetical protein Q7T33_01180 [Dehalococcoidia bacterium]|nr:hypothetical protein [Dehalococcoidia bacterium]